MVLTTFPIYYPKKQIKFVLIENDKQSIVDEKFLTKIANFELFGETREN